ncbi:MAG: signal peptidase II [Firmicutes bacterium]|nr:signal peptidase II [Bacillota bacterium]
MIWTILVLGILALDQYTKYLAATKLINYNTIPLIKNVFHLTFVENRGAAFGILQGQKWLLIVVTSTIIIAMVYYVIKSKSNSRLLLASFSMVIGGAIGNLIDRVRLGYVIDFLDVYIYSYNYPVFNIADSFVVVGTIFLSYYILFKYEDKKDEA